MEQRLGRLRQDGGLGLLVLGALMMLGALPAQACDKAQAVAAVRSATGAWIQHEGGASAGIQGGEPVCTGTQLSVPGPGQIEIELIAPEAIAANANRPIINLGAYSSLSFAQPVNQTHWFLKLVDGWFRFFSPRATTIDVQARYLTAGVKGTEFVMQSQQGSCSHLAQPDSVAGCDALWVQEGTVGACPPGVQCNFTSADTPPPEQQDVIAFNANGTLNSAAERTLLALPGGELRLGRLDIHPDDAVNWVLYYPPLARLEIPVCDPQRIIEDSRDPEVLACGTPSAIAQALRGPARDADVEQIIVAALRLIQAGSSGKAIAALQSLASERKDAELYALLSVIALKQNDLKLAESAADSALQVDAESADALLAKSYVLQAQFKLDEARVVTEQAAKQAPQEPLIAARLAELSLSLDESGLALEQAKQAVRLVAGDSDGECRGGDESEFSRDPIRSRAWSVLGFTYLVRVDTDQARRCLQIAAQTDNLAPLPELGLGLAMIRQGDLDAGVRHLERAVALDPRVSLYRAYLGKGYFGQNAFDLAAKELKLAKLYDTADPTAWLYDAFRLQAENNPVEAFESLEKSKARNDQRAIYRSRLMLDSDSAVRSTGLGHIYQELGFEELARQEASQSLAQDPTDYAAHRLLTDANSRKPRHEIARVSELLQARMRAPKAQHPVSAQIADTRLDSHATVQALDPGFNEYSRLFDKDGVHVTVDLLGGSEDTFNEEIRLSWADGPASMAFTQLHTETDGFRPKNYVDQDYFNVLGQYRLNAETSVQIEYRNLDSEYGDPFWGFDPTDYFDTDDTVDDVESWRLGGHHVISSNWDIVGFYRREDAYLSIIADDGSFDAGLEETGDQGEFQMVGRFDSTNVVIGGTIFDRDRFEEEDIPPFPITNWEWKTKHRNAYALTTFHDVTQGSGQSGDTLGAWDFTLGAAYERIEENVTSFDTFGFLGTGKLTRERLLPKLGFEWTLPGSRTTIRAARFDTIKRALLSNETLEPTTIAGFNQFYDDPEATLAKATALGIDFAPHKSLLVGAHAMHRKLSTMEVDRYALALLTNDIEERTASAYLNWLISQRWAFSLTYDYEHFDRNPFGVSRERIIDAQTHRLTANVRYFDPSGMTLSVEPVFAHQDGEFMDKFFFPYSGEDSFLILNASVSYRLPKQRGKLSLVIENAFDKTFQYQDTDPFAPRYAPERAVYLRAAVNFH